MICCHWSLNNWFENTIYFFILLSMIILTLDGPMNHPNSTFTKGLNIIDIFISTIFAIEAACRIIALGFFTSSLPGRKGYIQIGANQIDFMVIIGCDLILMYNNHFSVLGLND